MPAAAPAGLPLTHMDIKDDVPDWSADAAELGDVADAEANVHTKTLAEYLDEALAERRSASNRSHDTWDEFLDWYGDYISAFI